MLFRDTAIYKMSTQFVDKMFRESVVVIIVILYTVLGHYVHYVSS